MTIPAAHSMNDLDESMKRLQADVDIALPFWLSWLRLDLCCGLARSCKPRFSRFATSCSSSSASAPEGASTFRPPTGCSGPGFRAFGRDGVKDSFLCARRP